MNKTSIIGIILVVLASLGIIGYQFWLYQMIPKPVETVVTRGVSSLLEDQREKDGDQLIVLPERITQVTSQDAIPAINDPHYDSIGMADTYLSDSGLGIAVTDGEEPLFFSFQIMSWHEIVNDDLDGINLAVTYCPLCHSVAVYERGETTFGTTGSLYENNLVMYSHEDNSYWSQIFGIQIKGNEPGLELEQRPATLINWEAFKSQYPNGYALNRNTGAERDYTMDPYWEYYENTDIRFPLHHVDTRLAIKDMVLGFHQGTQYAKAWSMDQISLETVINDTVKDLKIVIMHDKDFLTTRTFSRVVDNQTLTFKWNGDLLMDEQTGTVWSFYGFGLDGELAGVQLKEIITTPSYWFCWVAHFPGTELYEH